MKLSNYFLPVLKENPKEAQIVSHQIMLRAGMIRQLASGIYNWLPLGLKVLRKIENIVREEMNDAGAIELLMPTMQPAELWQESGRGDYGKETLKAKDRHDRDLIYGPTNEEIITDIFRKNITSYKQLPKNIYQIQWKFRDEIRPRFGVMRGREFLMKDAYTFDYNEDDAVLAYENMYRTYFKIFKRLGLSVIPFEADTGLIGGKLSHEFQVIAETGESAIYYDKAFEDVTSADEIDIEKARSLYARADEKHDADNCPIPPSDLKSARGIEVGHIFYFGDKYSKPMDATITNDKGENMPVLMGAHGIGISRLLGAIIEANHDDKGAIFPKSVAPFEVVIINVRQKDETCHKICEGLYKTLKNAGIDVAYDDRDESAGSKFATAELIGIPTLIAIGPRSVAANKVEVSYRATGQTIECGMSEVLERV